MVSRHGAPAHHMCRAAAQYPPGGRHIHHCALCSYGSGHMLGDRLTRGDRRRPMLLALVFGVALVLVGVTASALVAVASDHLASATLGGVVNRDATLVELFVNGELRADDLASDGRSDARVRDLGEQLAALTERDG